MPPEVDAPTPPSVLRRSRSVPLIRRTRRLLHQHWKPLLFGGLLLALAVWLGRGVYTIDSGQTAAVQRFGALVDDTVAPGLHLALPPGLDRVHILETGEVSSVEVTSDLSPTLSLVSGDLNLIEARVVVQYRIRRPGKFLWATENPEGLIQQVVRACLLEEFAATAVDDLLTSAKARLQQHVRQEAQRRLEDFDAGIDLVAVNLQSVDPPREASGAFRDVSDARAEASQVISEAEGRRARDLRLARGEAEGLIETARADADSRRRAAEGAADRFVSLLSHYRISPQQTRVELYNQTMERVLPETHIFLLAPGQQPQIDLQLVEPGTLSSGKTPPQTAPRP